MTDKMYNDKLVKMYNDKLVKMMILEHDHNLDMYKDLVIVGTTTIPDNLIAPHICSPIYQYCSNRNFYYVSAAWKTDSLALVPISQLYLKDLVKRGKVILFEHSFPALPNHILIFMRPGKLPEYFPLQNLPINRKRIAIEAIDAAVAKINCVQYESAIELVWYACRADPDDPLALLVLIKLLYDDPNVELLHRELLKYTSQTIEDAERRMNQKFDFTNLS